MHETPTFPGGTDLPRDQYTSDFGTRFWRMDHSGGWKLERRQIFREEDNPSWTAFNEGDWERATAILEANRPELLRYQRKVMAHGFEFRRVRVVKAPYSEYLVWELHALMIRHECGDRIRVIPSTSLSDVERDGRLPEIVTLGSEVVYQVRYDDIGRIIGATRSTDSDSVRTWAEFIRHLYDQGEDLPAFFHREIAGLRPARTG